MAHTLLELYCCLEGNLSKHCFPIHVAPAMDIDDVKAIVVARLREVGQYGSGPASNLLLFKADETNLEGHLVIRSERDMLLSSPTVALYWPGQPPLNRIHIIIRLPRDDNLLLLMFLEDIINSQFTIRITNSATVDDLKSKVLGIIRDANLPELPSSRLNFNIYHIERYGAMNMTRTLLDPHLSLSSYWKTQDAVTGILQVSLKGGPRVILGCFSPGEKKRFLQTICRNETVNQLVLNIIAFLGRPNWRAADVVLRKVLPDGDRVALKPVDMIGSYWAQQPEVGIDVEVTHEPPVAGYEIATLRSHQWKLNPYHFWEVARDAHPSLEGVPANHWIVDMGGFLNALLGKDLQRVIYREDYRVMLRAVDQVYHQGNYTSDTVGAPLNDPDEKLSDPFLNGIFTSYDADSRPEMSGASFLICGQPGIGKTIGLVVILFQRLQHHLPTIFMNSSETLLLFKDGMVQSIDALSIDSFYFPGSTWVLINSTQDFEHVPLVIQQLGLFTVQAASSYDSRWYHHHQGGFVQFYLKPWSLSELLIGRPFQPNVQRERRLEAFFHKFGPSAGMAYACAGATEHYEERLRDEVSRVSLEVLEHALSNADSVHTALLSNCVLVEHPDNAARYRCNPLISTPFVMELLTGALAQRKVKAISRLYNLFLSYPTMRAQAEWLVNSRFTNILSKGGEWELLELYQGMKRANRTYYATPKNSE